MNELRCAFPTKPSIKSYLVDRNCLKKVNHAPGPVNWKVQPLVETTTFVTQKGIILHGNIVVIGMCQKKRNE